MVGSHSRVRLVEFDCICLRRSVVSEKEEKKGNKEKKERWKTKRCLQRNQTVATVDNRPRLLAGEGVLEASDHDNIAVLMLYNSNQKSDTRYLSTVRIVFAAISKGIKLARPKRTST